MIFYILTGVAILVSLGAFVLFISEEGPFGILMGLGVTALTGLAWILMLGLLVLVSASMPENHTESKTVTLKALGSDSSVSGMSYFLGGGYVEGNRVLSYIRENDNGSFTADQVKAKHAQVWEDSETDPTMTTYTHSSDRWWLIPVKIKVSSSWEFHIPEGSVNSEFSVTP